MATDFSMDGVATPTWFRRPSCILRVLRLSDDVRGPIAPRSALRHPAVAGKASKSGAQVQPEQQVGGDQSDEQQCRRMEEEQDGELRYILVAPQISAVDRQATFAQAAREAHRDHRHQSERDEADEQV